MKTQQNIISMQKKKELLVKGDVRALTNECPTRQVQDVT